MKPDDFLRNRQNKFPLDHSEDRAKKLYSYLRARLPGDVVQLFSTGQVACAEIGIPSPNAVTYSLPGNSSAIEIWTGIERFLYRVARVVSTRVRVYSDPASPPVEPSLSPEQTLSLLREVFENFMRFGISKGPPAGSYAISDSQKEVASMLTTDAEIFVLGHEIGHAVIHNKRGDTESAHLETALSTNNKVLLSQAEEVAADQLALQFVLGANGGASGTQNLSLRMAYAGAEFTVRVFRCLEYIGFPFEVSHPLPSTRLQLLRESARKMCRDASQFREVTTVAFAFDELLESLESALNPAGQRTELVSSTSERCVSRMSVILEEGVKGVLSPEKVESSIIEIFRGLDSRRIQEVVRACVAGFGHAAGTVSESEMESGKRDLLKRVIAVLPQDLKFEFEKAMGT